MIYRNKSTGEVFALGKGKTVAAVGLAEDDVEVYTREEWELTQYHADREADRPVDRAPLQEQIDALVARIEVLENGSS